VLWEPNIMGSLLWLEPVRELQIAERTCVVASRDALPHEHRLLHHRRCAPV
jgi:hypothetical protein